jgi:hypothetical protein
MGEGRVPETQTSITIRRNSPDDVQQRQVIVKLDGAGPMYVSIKPEE